MKVMKAAAMTMNECFADCGSFKIFLMSLMFKMHAYDVLVVGCGLSGVVIAERFATILNKKVLIIDKRDHIGGNCYDYHDKETNILLNKYGAHLFHTNSERVWEYVNKFDKWIRWDHEVYSMVENKLVNIPVNINTVNQLCHQNIKNSVEMDEWLSNNQEKYDAICNSEEMAKSRIGNTLYEKMVKNYTYKQWGKYPSELDASVLARIPIRNNFDNRYFDDKYQALPEKGYTHFIGKILENQNIQVMLNVDYFNIVDASTFETIVYTGPIDQYYKDKNLEKLEYRSIDFHVERHFNTNYYQPNSVVNYPEPDVPFTRIVEYKHFLNQQSDHTVIVKEVSTDNGEPYYPVPNDKNLKLYEKYKQFASEEKNVHFLGRLADYKYFNMDTAILNSLEYFDKQFVGGALPTTSNVCIVVARYGENVEWTKQFPNVIIYNKGNALNDGYNEIALSNVGREGHTYYKHICDNYDNLADYTVFLQGNPFDHSPNIVSNLTNYVVANDLNLDFDYLSETLVECNLTGCVHHHGLPLIETYEKIFNERKEFMEFKFGAGAQFIVSKQTILNKPKSFYDDIVSMLQNAVDPIEGYVIERFHKLIFETQLQPI